MKNLFYLLVAIFLFNACSSDDDNVAEDNRIAIENYLEENNLTAQSTDSGLYYIVEQEGNGTFPFLQDRVTVSYKLYRLNGEVLEQNNGVTFALLQVIPGWQEGIRKFSVGGSGKLFVPAHLAYGANNPSNNQPLIFDVDLLAVN